MTPPPPVTRPRLHLLELDLQHHVDEVSRACRALEAFAIEHGLAVAHRRRLLLVLDDALCNLVRYADGGGRPIAVRAELGPHQVVIVVVDHAAPFDPLAVRAPDTSLPIDERPVGGLGIHLMRTLMSDVQYGRDGERNVLRLTLTLTTSPAGDPA